MNEKEDRYKKLGLKCGLEIHQQLDTKKKLFCDCKTVIRDVNESTHEFFRYLRPTASEVAEIDRAALEQSKVKRKFVYKAYDTTCLIEEDEEPPRKLNKDALGVSLILVKLLNMNPVDEIHVMRKIVIDGSNTTGFQRTAFVAKDGFIDTDEGEVGIEVLCLEEDAAQKIEGDEYSVSYSLDRLGIPLIEIATAPDIISPSHAKETAKKIGMFFRSTGKVKRGLGTIRQDVNISISKGARVEIKGVQSLDLIETILENEVDRQVNLLEIKDRLIEKCAFVNDKIFDVTDIFKDGKFKHKKGKVLGVLLSGFVGFVGREIQTGRRLGTEFSDYAKAMGVGGILHTDELPNYGISQNEVDALRVMLDAKDEDAVVFVMGDEVRARNALNSVINRAKYTLMGIPEETRKALPDGNSQYMRPLSSAARMYPETDVPQIEIGEREFNSIEIPELLTDKAVRFMKEFDLNREFAEKIVYSQKLYLFENLVQKYDGFATLIVRTLIGTLSELSRDGVRVGELEDGHFMQLFELVSKGVLAKEGIDPVLRMLAKNPNIDVKKAVESCGFTGVNESEIREFIKNIVQERMDFVKERGVGAVGPLMGVVMKEFRGKVDGNRLRGLLMEEIEGVGV
ncbi:MAG: Glu-tRNA(Gln) amidotransferase subunit GatE [Methanosarcinaceae archaeon]|nr:Glu-tRNA(Gln) amidotransferase subunit GatE [Methanosarcinaceae archaeon]